MPIGVAELMRRFRVGAQPSEDFLDARPHDPGTRERSLGLRLEGSIGALPVESKAECCVEDGVGIERELRSVWGGVASMAVRPIGARVVAR